MHVHLIGVCGTGMGALAGLLREVGHRVSGSDVAFHPPMAPALESWGVEMWPGWREENLDPPPDLVVIGNVCRKDNPEARAAIDGGLRYASFPGVMEELFLRDRKSYVVAGTHGKTTTTSLLAHVLRETGADPGLLVGGIPLDFGRSFRLGGKGCPFVVEGDEYDSAFFEKTPKFWRYNPHGVVLTSIEHDHVDIYPTEESYLEAFSGLLERIPEEGMLVAFAGDPRVREVASAARCRIRWYALDGDECGDVTPMWIGAPARAIGGAQPFDLFGGGTFCGRVHSPLPGTHNVRNLVAVLALAAECARAPLDAAMRAASSFSGIRRRQELIAVAGDIRVYDDFAHHPTAVKETLRALRARHPRARLLAGFEPRSATASRKMHEGSYPSALSIADRVFLAPVGRPEIPAEERLDVAAVASAISETGRTAEALTSTQAVLERLLEIARSGDVIVLMSNGTFGGIHDPLVAELGLRAAAARRALHRSR